MRDTKREGAPRPESGEISQNNRLRHPGPLLRGSRDLAASCLRSSAPEFIPAPPAAVIRRAELTKSLPLRAMLADGGTGAGAGIRQGRLFHPPQDRGRG